jgi:hypothetical protein
MPAMKELIIGGARSGKSLLAERRAQEYAGPRKVIYVATAQALRCRDGPPHRPSSRPPPGRLGLRGSETAAPGRNACANCMRRTPACWSIA